MEATERTMPRLGDAPGNGGGPTAGEIGRATQRREQISHLLAASRAAVDRVLSTDSDTFLKQVKQHGGQ